MITAFRLAGFFAAHAIWSVSDGETLIPILAHSNQDDEREMARLAHDDLLQAVAFGKERLHANEMDANDACLLYDGRITLGDEKVDAIIIEIRSYFSPNSEALLAVPYTPSAAGKFLVHKPKLLEWADCDDFDPDAALEAFFEGVFAHKKGAKIWNEALDESK
jgi:hypothetical protein